MSVQLALPWGSPLAAIPEGLSPSRRRTARNRALLAAGIHPATYKPTLDQGTCGSCTHLKPADLPMPGTWKCERHRLGITRGGATDVRKSWPACALFDPVLAWDAPQRPRTSIS